MRDLIEQERFELEVLEKLNSQRLLGKLVFGGGTMLRLCYGLSRFSVDLDFWITKDIKPALFFKELKACLCRFFKITDSANKFYTLLFELKSKDYPRALKIEIRKQVKKVRSDEAIAYSPYSTTQVLLKTIALKEMMQAKAEALLERKEIRDAFDLEFLLKKGVPLDFPLKTLKKILKRIEGFSTNDYSVKLGSLLGPGERRYYRNQNFKILKSAIKAKLKE